MRLYRMARECIHFCLICGLMTAAVNGDDSHTIYLDDQLLYEGVPSPLSTLSRSQSHFVEQFSGCSLLGSLNLESRIAGIHFDSVAGQTHVYEGGL